MRKKVENFCSMRTMYKFVLVRKLDIQIVLTSVKLFIQSSLQQCIVCGKKLERI